MNKIIFLILFFISCSFSFAQEFSGYTTAASILLADTNNASENRIVYYDHYAYPFSFQGVQMFMNDFELNGSEDELLLINPVYENILSKESKSGFIRKITVFSSAAMIVGGGYYALYGDSSTEENTGLAVCISSVAVLLMGTFIAKKEAPASFDIYNFYNRFNSNAGNIKATVK